MKRQEHLLVNAMEECNEVAQRISKALRFGLQEVQPGQERTNAERILYEYLQLEESVAMLFREGLIPYEYPGSDQVHQKKREAFEKFLLLSKEQGTLTE